MVEYFIEATSFEQQILWERFHEKCDWKEDTGILLTVGYLDKNKVKPVSIHLRYAYLNNKRIAFYEVTSLYADMGMIGEYLAKHGRKIVNAQNFHNCFHDLTEKPDYHVILDGINYNVYSDDTILHAGKQIKITIKPIE